jgi:hypothetical protein
MSESVNQETLVGTGRKTVLTTLIAIALSPISLFLGYFLNHVLQSPKLHIEYVTPVAIVESQKFDPKVLEGIRQNHMFLQHLRGALSTFVGQDIGAPPTAWLDSGRWDDAFLTPALNATMGIAGVLDAEIELLEANLAALKTWTPPEPSTYSPFQFLISDTNRQLCGKTRRARLGR